MDNNSILNCSQRNLNISSNNIIIGNNFMNNVQNKSNELEERKIFEILNENKNLDLNKLVNLIRNLSDKYEDHKLDEQDTIIENSIKSALEKLHANKDYESDVAFNYFEFEKLLNFRMIKEIKPYYEPTSWIENLYSNNNYLINVNEIQIIYNLFFLHPCIFRDFFLADDDTENFILTKELLKGFQPLFKEMNIYSKRCISMENVIYLNFFNMLLDVWIIKISKNSNLTAENIFDNDNSFLTDFIEIYFYDEFRRSIFYDIFEKGLKDLNNLSRNKKQVNYKNAQKSEESLKISNLLNIFKYDLKAQDEKGMKVTI